MERIESGEIVLLRRHGHFRFKPRYGLEFLIEVADCVDAETDAQSVPTLVCRYSVIYLGLARKARVGPSQDLGVYPLQPDLLQSRTDLPLPQVVRS